MTTSLDILFFWMAFYLYLGGFLLFVLVLGVRNPKVSFVASGLMGIGFAAHTVGLILRWKIAGHPPFANSFGYISVMAWAAVGAFLVMLWKFRKPALGAFVAPFAFFLMGIASLFPKDISEQLMPALQSYWLYIHVIITVLGSGILTVAFGVSVMYLVKLRSVSSKGEGEGDRLPSLDLLDEINYRSVTIGYLLYTVGALICGAIWAHYAWGSFWSWDPKEVTSLIVWLFYTGTLHARYQRGWHGKRAAWLSIIGFAMILFSFLGNHVLGGLHAYD